MRTSRGTLYKRNGDGQEIPRDKEDVTPGRFYLLYHVNGKRFRQALKDENGTPVMTRRAAEKARLRVLAPVMAGDVAEQRRAVAHALQDAAQAAKEAEAAAKPKAKIAQAWTRYLDCQNRPQSSAATLEQYGFQWSAFARWLATNEPAADTISAVTPTVAERYVAALCKTLSPGTVNKHVRLLRLVFRVLGDKEPLPYGNPFDGIVSRQEVQQHRNEFRLDVLRTVFDAAEGETKTLLFLGLYTGQRLADCCLLTWDHVDLSGGWIRFNPHKTRRSGTTVSVPMFRDLRTVLDATPSESRRGYVLPQIAADYTANRDRVTDKLQGLFRRCGVEVHEPGTGPGTGKRAVLQYGFHSLRHATATILQEAGAPAAVAEAILGHRSEAMRRRYTHVGQEALLGAIRNMPSLAEARNGNDTPKALPAAVVEPERVRLVELVQTLPIAAVRRLLKSAEREAMR